MIRVLDLFAGTQSVRKALDEMGVEYEYYGIDIYSPEDENIILDLTQDFIVSKLIDALPQGWTPDFIWASPICNKFSMVLTGKGGNYYFEKDGDYIKPRENWDIKVQRHMNKYNNEDGRIKARQDALLAMKMHENTREIINHFAVPFAVENPAYAMSSYIWQNKVKNVAHYCAYGFDYKKPTAIYSDRDLKLNKCVGGHIHATMIGEKHKPKPTHWNPKVSTYANRSSVPPKLIKAIIKEAVNV